MFTVLTDSTCDLPESFQKEYGIEVLPGHVVLPDGKEILQYPRWEYFTKEEFYKNLKKDPDGFKTSPANVGEIKAKMEEEVKAGRGVLMITISSAISGSPEFARQAIALVKEEYPKAEVDMVDSLRFGPGLGLMSMYAAMKRDEGLTRE